MAILIDSVSKNLNPWLMAFKSYDDQEEICCFDDAVDLKKNYYCCGLESQIGTL